MKFVVVNSRINGHNCAWADEIYKILGDDFVFIEFKENPNIQHGSFVDARQGKDYHEGRPYVLKMYESEGSKVKAFQLINNADVVRMAGCPIEWVRERVNNGKLTFEAGERLFKRPLLFHSPQTLFKLYKKYKELESPNFRILCQSAYLPNDMQHFANYRRRCYKFAYIHQFPRIDADELFGGKKYDKLHIFWCARFLNLKHPELPVKLAQKLVESGRTNFEITMVGANTLNLWLETKKDVGRKGLDKYINLTGGLPNTEVLSRMRASNVFLFTSDRNEGWGVVLNEAMSSGCACVASNEIGSVPYLLKDGVNGLVFRSKSVSSLYSKVVELYDNPELCEIYGQRAYETINGMWSAKNVAKRLVELSQSILSGKEITYSDGPCSKAYPIR